MNTTNPRQYPSIREPLTAGAYNAVLLLAHGRNPILHGLSEWHCRLAMAHGYVNWNYDYIGQGYTLSVNGREMLQADGAI